MRAFRSMFYTGTVVQLVSVAVHFLGMSLKHEPASGQDEDALRLNALLQV